MNRIRLLPLVLVAISALLAVKILGFVTGVGSFAVGPQSATAEEGGGHGGEAAPPPGDTVQPLSGPLMTMTQPVDLAREAEQLKAAQAAAAAHGEGGHGEAAPAAGHGEAAPADAAHAEAAPAAAGHGEAAAAPAEAAPAAGHGDAAAAAPADAHAPAAKDAAAPAADGAAHGEAPATAAHGEAAPAAEGHGGGGEHGAAAPKGPVAYTQRPPEYTPPAGSSETAILNALSDRRNALDQREQDLDLRAKLLQAAEQRLDQRLQELKSIQQQLGGSDVKTADAKDAQEVQALVALYEAMKPKAAAVVFDKLDMTVLLQIATKMNPRKLSPIMAAMSPDKAGLLTIAMAGNLGDRKIVVQTEEAPQGLSPLLPEVTNALKPPASAQPSLADLPQIQGTPADPSQAAPPQP
ncbi:MotE family protein [Oryzibacter oryziterrae]|uniref:MotE family protein n=1 Tax=Oryzibacter oryziterrae TaxID=2766474 RepID=UPI001F3BAA61|nr:hypothetical protein [Oryzibacter oryziterrae]